MSNVLERQPNESYEKYCHRRTLRNKAKKVYLKGKYFHVSKVIELVSTPMPDGTTHKVPTINHELSKGTYRRH